MPLCSCMGAFKSNTSRWMSQDPKPVRMRLEEKEEVRARVRAKYNGSRCGDAIEEGGVEFQVRDQTGISKVERFFADYDVIFTRSDLRFYVPGSEIDMVYGGRQTLLFRQ
eukprot:TRINITY_DN25765_c0_g1_i2.p1 TRINITY_DN25765_c0_g1~~TRINITY_DN25765_c0_g1_i2.p1  ORF type:complete len:110 (+),score=11.66 TRINITY_DN25765_c0_g1_i2:29-358(+)